MAKCSAFRCEHQIHEDLTLEGHAIFKLFLCCSFYGINTLGWRRKILGHALDHIACKLEIGIALGMFARQVANQGKRCAICMLCCQLFGIRHGFGCQCFNRRCHAVEQFLARQHGQHFAVNGFAADNHVECGFNTQCTWQTLRAAGARDEAQLDFGQSYFASWRCNSVMATQGQFQTTTHGNGMDSGQNWLV